MCTFGVELTRIEEAYDQLVSCPPALICLPQAPEHGRRCLTAYGLSVIDLLEYFSTSFQDYQKTSQSTIIFINRLA